eukprot:10162831-Ditylum_brightwellii.AAC.1
MPHPALVAHHIFDAHGKKQSISDLLQGNMRNTWLTFTDNELGCLADGIPGSVEGSNTGFIKKSAIPKGKKVTYTNMLHGFTLGTLSLTRSSKTGRDPESFKN